MFKSPLAGLRSALRKGSLNTVVYDYPVFLGTSISPKLGGEDTLRVASGALPLFRELIPYRSFPFLIIPIIAHHWSHHDIATISRPARSNWDSDGRILNNA